MASFASQGNVTGATSGQIIEAYTYLRFVGRHWCVAVRS
jgi:hypothetical protein